MHTPSKLAIITVALVSSSCIQQSFNQMSISDSQPNDTTQASAGATGETASSSVTDTGTSGGTPQTGGASGSMTTALSTTSDTGTTMQVDDGITGSTTEGTSTSGSSASTATTSIESTTDQELCAVTLENTCYTSDKVRIAFVTSKTYTGAMMGNPDALCNEAAKNLPGAGEYKAWATINDGSPVERFDTTFAGPYVKLKPGHPEELTLVAMGWKGLTMEDLKTPIDVDENGDMVTGYAWTGAKSNGDKKYYLLHCDNWKNDNPSKIADTECDKYVLDHGSAGEIGKTSPTWSYIGTTCDKPSETCCQGNSIAVSKQFECDQKHHLYCFRDPTN